MTVSSVGFGTYHLRDKIGASEAIDAMGAAYEAGITLYDTSDNYGTEELIGLAVREGVLPRDEVVIATKTGLATYAQEHLAWQAEDKHVDITPVRIREQVEKSLRLLGEDVGVIDLYQLHSYDPSIPPHLPVRAMNRLMEEGKIRAYGVSNYPAQAIADVLHVCDEEGFEYPATSQPFANLVNGWDEAAGLLTSAEGITTLAHSPLHKGLLSESMLSRLDDLITQAEPRGGDFSDLKLGLGYLAELRSRAWDTNHSLTQLALAWVAMHPNTVVLSSPTDDERLHDVKEAVAWKPDDKILELIDEAQTAFAKTGFVDQTLRLMKNMKIYYR